MLGHGGGQTRPKMVKSYQKETEEGGRSRVLGHGGKQTRPTFKIFSLGETEGVRTLTNIAGIYPLYKCEGNH